MSDRRTDEPPDVVFLLGAGASVHLGIPAMHGMYKAFLNKSKSGIGDKEKKTCQLFTKELGVKEDLEEFLLAANVIVESKGSSLLKLVERAISHRRASNRVLDYRKRLASSVSDVVAVRRSILDFLSRMCFQFDRGKAIATLDGFVKAVAAQGCPIYTTNYDFSLEHVAQEKDVEIQDNFIRKGLRELWNPQMEFPIGNALTIVKLHGSVTWYVDKRGTIEKLYSNTDINSAGHDIERVLIFPTRFKDIYEQHFFALYSHFLAALSSARILIVIGHSLRDEYLRAGIIERFRKGGFQLVVIDPSFPKDLPDEMTPGRAGVSGQVTHVPYPFELFADEVASILGDTKPADIAAACAAVVHHKKARTDKVTIKGNVGILRPGQKKTFKARIDAYLEPNEKPARLRVWLGAKWVLPDGNKRDEVTRAFLEEGEIEIGKGLSGMVNTEVPLVVTVPEYPEWIKHAGKVRFCVGVLKRHVKKPVQASASSILAQDTRELSYTR